MKNIFRFLMAVAVLFTASCAKEDISSSIGGGEVEVTFTANLPELGTRAYGEGSKIKTLRYYVFDQNGTLLEGLSNSITKDPGTKFFSVTLVLIKGMTYNILFWADSNSGHYSVGDNGIISVVNTPEHKINANDESRDAFYAAVKGFNPADANADTTIELYRPFAQLNAKVTNMDEVNKSIKVESTTISTKIYTTFNPLFAANENEVVGGLTANPVEFTATPMADADIAAGHLSMNYLLAPADGCVADVAFTFNNNKGVAITGTTYTNVPLKANYRTNIIGALLTNSTDFTVEILPGFGGEEKYDVEDIHVATAQELAAAVNTVAATGGEVVLVEDIELSETISIIDQVASTTSRTAAANEKVIIIDGKGKTLTYTGSGASARAIDVTAKNVNLTIKNLTIDCTSSYCQRGINYNTTGTLTLENVTVKGKNVTYALNLPGSSDNANVTINNSSLTGNIALNVWGENSTITATDSHFTSVDKSTAEGYSAIALNSDGTTIANGTVVNINGGSITAKDENGELASAIRNSTSTGIVNVSESTVVTGNLTSPVAIINYGTDQFYSCDTLQRAINKAAETNAASVVLIKDIELEETAVIAEGATIVLDLNGKTLSAKEEANAYVLNNLGTLTIKGNGVVNARGIYNGYGNGGDNVTTAKLIIENGTFNAKGTNGGAAVYNYGTVEIKGGTFESNGGYGLNNQAGGTLSVNNATVNGGIYNVGTLTINNSTIYQHLSGKHAIYNWQGTVTINSGNFDSISGNELIFADGTNASVVINDGTFNKTAKSWLYAAPANKGISFVIKGGNHNGYVNMPEGTVDPIRDYNPKEDVVIEDGIFNFNPTKWLAEGYKAVEVDGKYVVVSENINVASTPIVNKEGETYFGDFFENPIQNALIFQNWIFSGDATIKVENKTYGAIILDNVTGSINGNAIEINNDNNSVMILQNVDLTLAEGKKLIKSVNKIYQVFMSNITINGVEMTNETIAQYLENVEWYQVVEEI